MASVEFENVTKAFDEHTLALRNFSLSIEDGEFMVLVGPSGCGKSTALRLLAGLEQVSDGHILIDGKQVDQMSPQQRNTAMVFQNYALYPHMSVRRNLEFPLRMAKLPKQTITEKVEKTAETLDLTLLLERKPKQLSGGQRQRVAMGRALVRNPSVFLLDEPLSNLDAKLRAQIRAEIARLQKQLNKTSLYVTHDQVEAMTLGDRVAVMNNGELQQVGTPEQLYAQPKNIFVAKFIGSPGMNIIRSTLHQEDDTFVMQLGKTDIHLSPSNSENVEILKKYLNQPLCLGIRPEVFNTEKDKNDSAIWVNIVSVEYLGHESLIYFRLIDIDNKPVDDIYIARIEGKFSSSNETDQQLFFNPAAICLFDEDGTSLPL